jgi:hypothetical protein
MSEFRDRLRRMLQIEAAAQAAEPPNPNNEDRLLAEQYKVKFEQLINQMKVVQHFTEINSEVLGQRGKLFIGSGVHHNRGTYTSGKASGDGGKEVAQEDFEPFAGITLCFDSSSYRGRLSLNLVFYSYIPWMMCGLADGGTPSIEGLKSIYRSASSRHDVFPPNLRSTNYRAENILTNQIARNNCLARIDNILLNCAKAISRDDLRPRRTPTYR